MALLEETAMKNIYFPREFKKRSCFLKNNFTAMKITDKKDETLFKNVYFKFAKFWTF